MRRHGQAEVETVDEADAIGGEVVVAVVEAELDEGGRGFAAGAVALKLAAAVAGGAGEAFVSGDAAGAAPDAAGPVLGRGREGTVGEGVEGEAAALQDGVADVGLDGGPDGVRAVVDQGQDHARLGVGCGLGEGQEKQNSGQEDRERRRGRGHCCGVTCES